MFKIVTIEQPLNLSGDYPAQARQFMRRIQQAIRDDKHPGIMLDEHNCDNPVMQYPQIRIALADLHAQFGHHQQSRRILDAFLAEDPLHPIIRKGQARFAFALAHDPKLLDSKHINPEALDIIENLIKAAPNMPSPYILLATCYRRAEYMIYRI